MSAQPQAVGLKSILSVSIQQEQDLVIARQRARQLSSMLGFGPQDQTKIATAVSEIARNSYQYARGGRVEFSIDLQARPQILWIEVSDRGPGIRDVESVLGGAYVSSTGMGLGLAGASRLMDKFDISSSSGTGTIVRLGKAVPPGAPLLRIGDVGQVCSVLAAQRTAGLDDELGRQNRDLLQTLDALRQSESELKRRQQDLERLNVELEETNRGVVALYAELDEKAVALRRADEMKSRFLSHVSHEFRTPVNAVLALTRLLLQRVDGDLSTEQEKQVAYIRDAAQQLAEMVNDLLDLAKVESGKTEVRTAPIDLNQFLGATRALMRPLASSDAVALIFEEPVFPLVFESDESKLGQIIRNLISNALKFTQRGEVRVNAALSETGDTLIISVADTGIGIAPEDQERVFQEFAQIEHPIQKHVKGTGLGLPLSRKLAALLDGSLTLESVIGVGSTFKLMLPYRTVSQVDVPPNTDPATNSSKVVLIVDDEPPARYLAHRLFQGTEHRIIEASASDAVERARFEAPALIVLDLNMPDRSGFQILNDLKSDELTKNIPVIIHTSKVMTEGDAARLGGKHAALLPKGTEGRLPAFLAMRDILGEPHLFAAEPEFN